MAKRTRLVMHSRISIAVGIVLPLLLAPHVLAQNWPQWRGPSSQAVSFESVPLPTKWSAGENIAWKVSLAGLGVSSPIVWGDTVVVTSQVGQASVQGGSHPQLARDDRSLADRENPIGGRRMPAAPVRPHFPNSARAKHLPIMTPGVDGGRITTQISKVITDQLPFGHRLAREKISAARHCSDPR
jgi:hypothetical protein